MIELKAKMTAKEIEAAAKENRQRREQAKADFKAHKIQSETARVILKSCDLVDKELAKRKKKE